METNNWVIILVPILFEGIIIFFFQLYINRRFEKKDRKLAIQDDAVKLFLSKVRETTILEQEVFNGSVELSTESLQVFLDQLNALKNIYRAYEHELKKFKKEFESFYNSWGAFVDLWNKNSGREVDPDLRAQLTERYNICNLKMKELQEALIYKR